MVTFGDGTSNSGLLYESLNLASMLHLPVVFVCQNNQYAVSMPAARSIGGSDLAARARAIGVEAHDVDGNDVRAVHATVAAALSRARQGGGPTFIHALTYRVSGHWASDTCTYRDAAESAAWQNRDPVDLFCADLLARGVLDAPALGALRSEIQATATQALAEAQSDALPGDDVAADANAYI
jgi:TPP-dependent pyruvate/acetoin dehydrogenase alpha subunit